MGDEPDRVAMVSDLRLLGGDLRREIGDVRSELRQEIATVKTELRQEIGAVKTELRQEIGAVKSELSERIDRLEAQLTKRIASDGKRTRRHFKIMVEEVQTAVKLVAEVNAHHAVVLDNHETRLTQIEKTR